jgi:hypothetical protein
MSFFRSSVTSICGAKLWNNYNIVALKDLFFIVRSFLRRPNSAFLLVIGRHKKVDFFMDSVSVGIPPNVTKSAKNMREQECENGKGNLIYKTLFNTKRTELRFQIQMS